MAEEETGSESQSQAAAGKGMFRLIMLVAVVVLASAAGAGVSMFLAGSGGPVESVESDDDVLAEYLDTDDDGTYEYVEFQPITTNLDERRLGRHIQVVPVLAIPAKNKKLVEQAKKDIEAKQKELANWLTVYFAGCTLDQVRGSGNLNRIQREIRQEFNDRLWRDKKPLIHHVLFKEFKIQ